ncbi:MAG: phosphatidate cytidylyltransferase [Chitinophagaceae bacterium]
MAFNLATFRTRALSSVVFVLIMAAGVLWNEWSFFILFSIIHFGCWLEYQKLVGLIDKEYATITSFHKYGVIIAGWCMMLYATPDSSGLFGIRLHALGWWMGLVFVFVLPIVELLFANNIRLKNIAHSAFGLVYLSLSCALMIDLYDHKFQVSNEGVPFAKEPFAHIGAAYAWFIPAFVIVCMWINDTMAYIVGSLIGRTPFSSISPKKTWEGTIGGIILCIAAAGYLGHVLNKPESAEFVHIPYYHWYIIAGIAAIAGTAGDLLESKLKRLAGVKDSGNLMPGHGGFLDRFDSLLLATPFVWLYLHLIA